MDPLPNCDSDSGEDNDFNVNSYYGDESNDFGSSPEGSEKVNNIPLSRKWFESITNKTPIPKSFMPKQTGDEDIITLKDQVNNVLSCSSLIVSKPSSDINNYNLDEHGDYNILHEVIVENSESSSCSLTRSPDCLDSNTDIQDPKDNKLEPNLCSSSEPDSMRTVTQLRIFLPPVKGDNYLYNNKTKKLHLNPHKIGEVKVLGPNNTFLLSSKQEGLSIGKSDSVMEHKKRTVKLSITGNSSSKNNFNNNLIAVNGGFEGLTVENKVHIRKEIELSESKPLKIVSTLTKDFENKADISTTESNIVENEDIPQSTKEFELEEKYSELKDMGPGVSQSLECVSTEMCEMDFKRGSLEEPIKADVYSFSENESEVVSEEVIESSDAGIVEIINSINAQKSGNLAGCKLNDHMLPLSTSELLQEYGIPNIESDSPLDIVSQEETVEMEPSGVEDITSAIQRVDDESIPVVPFQEMKHTDSHNSTFMSDGIISSTQCRSMPDISFSEVDTIPSINFYSPKPVKRPPYPLNRNSIDKLVMSGIKHPSSKVGPNFYGMNRDRNITEEMNHGISCSSSENDLIVKSFRSMGKEDADQNLRNKFIERKNHVRNHEVGGPSSSFSVLNYGDYLQFSSDLLIGGKICDQQSCTSDGKIKTLNLKNRMTIGHDEFNAPSAIKEVYTNNVDGNSFLFNNFEKPDSTVTDIFDLSDEPKSSQLSPKVIKNKEPHKSSKGKNITSQKELVLSLGDELEIPTDLIDDKSSQAEPIEADESASARESLLNTEKEEKKDFDIKESQKADFFIVNSIEKENSSEEPKNKENSLDAFLNNIEIKKNPINSESKELYFKRNNNKKDDKLGLLSPCNAQNTSQAINVSIGELTLREDIKLKFAKQDQDLNKKLPIQNNIPSVTVKMKLSRTDFSSNELKKDSVSLSIVPYEKKNDCENGKICPRPARRETLEIPTIKLESSEEKKLENLLESARQNGTDHLSEEIENEDVAKNKEDLGVIDLETVDSVEECSKNDEDSKDPVEHNGEHSVCDTLEPPREMDSKEDELLTNNENFLVDKKIDEVKKLEESEVSNSILDAEPENKALDKSHLECDTKEAEPESSERGGKTSESSKLDNAQISFVENIGLIPKPSCHTNGPKNLIKNRFLSGKSELLKNNFKPESIDTVNRKAIIIVNNCDSDSDTPDKVPFESLLLRIIKKGVVSENENNDILRRKRKSTEKDSNSEVNKPSKSVPPTSTFKGGPSEDPPGQRTSGISDGERVTRNVTTRSTSPLKRVLVEDCEWAHNTRVMMKEPAPKPTRKSPRNRTFTVPFEVKATLFTIHNMRRVMKENFVNTIYVPEWFKLGRNMKRSTRRERYIKITIDSLSEGAPVQDKRKPPVRSYRGTVQINVQGRLSKASPKNQRFYQDEAPSSPEETPVPRTDDFNLFSHERLVRNENEEIHEMFSNKSRAEGTLHDTNEERISTELQKNSQPETSSKSRVRFSEPQSSSFYRESPHTSPRNNSYDSGFCSDYIKRSRTAPTAAEDHHSDDGELNMQTLEKMITLRRTKSEAERMAETLRKEEGPARKEEGPARKEEGPARKEEDPARKEEGPLSPKASPVESSPWFPAGTDLSSFIEPSPPPEARKEEGYLPGFIDVLLRKKNMLLHEEKDLSERINAYGSMSGNVSYDFTSREYDEYFRQCEEDILRGDNDSSLIGATTKTSKIGDKAVVGESSELLDVFYGFESDICDCLRAFDKNYRWCSRNCLKERIDKLHLLKKIIEAKEVSIMNEICRPPVQEDGPREEGGESSGERERAKCVTPDVVPRTHCEDSHDVTVCSPSRVCTVDSTPCKPLPVPLNILIPSETSNNQKVTYCWSDHCKDPNMDSESIVFKLDLPKQVPSGDLSISDSNNKFVPIKRRHEVKEQVFVKKRRDVRRPLTRSDIFRVIIEDEKKEEDVVEEKQGSSSTSTENICEFLVQKPVEEPSNCSQVTPVLCKPQPAEDVPSGSSLAESKRKSFDDRDCGLLPLKKRR